MKRVQIVTVSTAPHHKYQKLQKQTAKKWGYEYTSIGQNVEWKGFVTKMKLPLQYLNKQLASDASLNDVASETLYVFVDAYDLVFAGPPEELLKKYLEFGMPIVVGAENVCFANCQPSTCEIPSPDTRRYINTGCVMGSAKDLISYYRWGIANYPADDQVAMSRYRNLYCDTVALDTEAKIVFNYAASIDYRQQLLLGANGRFALKTKETPCLVHCPFIFQDLGSRWEYVLSHLLPDYEPSDTTGQYVHSLVKYSTKVMSNNKTYFVFVICMCYGILLFLIALICAGVFGFQSLKQWMEKFENGD